MPDPIIVEFPDPMPNRLQENKVFSKQMDLLMAVFPQMRTDFINLLALVNTAAAAPGMSATSLTSLMIEVAAKTLTVETGKQFVPGMTVTIGSVADATDRMIGTVTSYDAGTGQLDVTVTLAEGSGTFADWAVSISLPIDVSQLVMKDEPQLLTQKGLIGAEMVGMKFLDIAQDQYYEVDPSELTTNIKLKLPVMAADDEFLFKLLAQTLENKSYKNAVFLGSVNEQEAELTGDALDASGGTRRWKTFTGTTTITDSLNNGEYLMLRAFDMTQHTVTLPTTKWIGGAPVLTDDVVFILAKLNGTLIGAGGPLT